MLDNIQVGDKVKFELNSRLSQPRWNYRNDNGASGKYIVGEVLLVEFEHGYFQVKYFVNIKGTMVAHFWDFVLPHHYDYPGEVEGFPTIVEKAPGVKLEDIFWF